MGETLIQPVGWAEASRNAEAIFARLARPQLGRPRALPGYRARFRHSPLAVSRLADASRDRSVTSAIRQFRPPLPKVVPRPRAQFVFPTGGGVYRRVICFPFVLTTQLWGGT